MFAPFVVLSGLGNMIDGFEVQNLKYSLLLIFLNRKYSWYVLPLLFCMGV
jgi:cytochrome c oxidase subunit IV